jgi:hypothetical protein
LCGRGCEPTPADLAAACVGDGGDGVSAWLHDSGIASQGDQGTAQVLQFLIVIRFFSGSFV